MAIFCKMRCPKKMVFFVDFFWGNVDGELAIVLHQFLMEESWWWRVQVPKTFSAQKTKEFYPPWNIHSKRSRKLVESQKGNHLYLYSNHPFSGAWAFSFRKFLWPFWYLFVRSVYHSQQIFPVFFLFSPGFFFETKHMVHPSIDGNHFPPI